MNLASITHEIIVPFAKWSYSQGYKCHIWWNHRKTLKTGQTAKTSMRAYHTPQIRPFDAWLCTIDLQLIHVPIFMSYMRVHMRFYSYSKRPPKPWNADFSAALHVTLWRECHDCVVEWRHDVKWLPNCQFVSILGRYSMSVSHKNLKTPVHGI